jgi:hypothetical protein
MKINLHFFVYAYVNSGDRGNSLCPTHRVIQFGDQPVKYQFIHYIKK